MKAIKFHCAPAASVPRGLALSDGEVLLIDLVGVLAGREVDPDRSGPQQ
jgi:hypothetical protein